MNFLKHNSINHWFLPCVEKKYYPEHCYSMNTCYPFKKKCPGYGPECHCWKPYPTTCYQIQSEREYCGPLRTMQKALSDKWTELATLGQQAECHFAERSLLQHQLAKQRRNLYQLNKYCLCKNPEVCYCYTPPQYQRSYMVDDGESCTRAIKMCESPKRACICNGPQSYEEDCDRRNWEPVQRQCFLPYNLELERRKTEEDVDQLSRSIQAALCKEKEVLRQLNDVRCDLVTMQAKMKSCWGRSVVEKSTPASENRSRFY